LVRNREPLPVAEPTIRAWAVASEPQQSIVWHSAVRVLPQLCFALSIFLLVAVIGIFIFRASHADRIYPSVVIADVHVGSLTVEQATARITERAARLERSAVSFSFGEQEWTPTLSELGISLQVEEAIAQARQLGRTDDAVHRLLFMDDLLRGEQVIPLTFTMNHDTLNAWFDMVDRQIAVDPIDAVMSVEAGNIVISPETEGLAVDRAVATAQIVAALTDLDPLIATLPTRAMAPAVRAADLEQARVQATIAISGSISVTFAGQSWMLDGRILAHYATVETVLEDGRPVTRFGLDRATLAADLRAEYGPRIERAPTNAIVGWDEGLIALEPGSAGISLRSMAFAEAVEASFLGDHYHVAIPYAEVRPDIDDQHLADLGIAELLGRGESAFVGGSAERIANIHVASGILNGTLVPPGALFSFNQAIGEITAEKGYLEASVVVAEQPGRDIGGGVCQVSTTVFRAALMAGLPIGEWNPHTYRIPGYEGPRWQAGFDASILQMGPDPNDWGDLEFRNDTAHWLLVEVVVSEQTMTVDIYGSPDGRTVELDWWGIPNGKDTGFTYQVFDASGRLRHERAFDVGYK
jgi:vancomycin resistance protein YoaR